MVANYVAASGEVSPNWDWGSSPAPADQSRYKSRTWTNTTGEFSVEAVFVSYANGQVRIKRDDSGEVITIPLDSLSQNCKQYAKRPDK